MSAITRATWGERVVGGDPVAGYAHTHAAYCPDAPTPTKDTTA